MQQTSKTSRSRGKKSKKPGSSSFRPSKLSVKMPLMQRLPVMNFSIVRKTIIILFLLIVAFGAGFAVAKQGYALTPNDNLSVNISRTLPEEHKNLDFSLFWKVWDSLDQNYFDTTKLDESAMVYGAIRGMVSAVGDPYTVFLPPDENKITQEDLLGTFEGVGIQIGFKGTRLAVIAPLPGSPGEIAGILAGDLIVGIKDEEKDIDRSTSGITLPEAVEAIRGPKGSVVTLALVREGTEDPIIVDVKRDSIDVASVVLDFVGENQNIARLKVTKFSAETKIEWDNAIEQVLAKDNLDGVIVDVRNNPGGYLQAAIDLAGEFMRNGSTVVVEETRTGGKRSYKVDRIGHLLDVDVIVLINGGSASASEILAGALRDDKKVQLVGETSFGKGTIQEPIQIEGAGLHITTSRWLTPTEFWVHEKGLDPDVVVEDNRETTEDEQLDAALSLFN